MITAPFEVWLVMGPNLDVVIEGFIMLSLETGKSALHVKHVKRTNKKTNPLTFESKCVFASGGYWRHNCEHIYLLESLDFSHIKRHL